MAESFGWVPIPVAKSSSIPSATAPAKADRPCCGSKKTVGTFTAPAARCWSISSPSPAGRESVPATWCGCRNLGPDFSFGIVAGAAPPTESFPRQCGFQKVLRHDALTNRLRLRRRQPSSRVADRRICSAGGDSPGAWAATDAGQSGPSAAWRWPSWRSSWGGLCLSPPTVVVEVRQPPPPPGIGRDIDGLRLEIVRHRERETGRRN